jgi:hypothetical protein
MAEPGGYTRLPLPRSVARLLELTQRRLARARRRNELGVLIAESRRPKVLTAATRLSAARRRGGRVDAAGLPAVTTARAGSHPATTSRVEPLERPAWWGELGSRFGVSDWALEQLFGDQRVESDVSATQAEGVAARAPSVAGADLPPPATPARFAPAPAAQRAAARRTLAHPRQQRILEGPAPRPAALPATPAASPTESAQPRRLARAPVAGRSVPTTGDVSRVTAMTTASSPPIAAFEASSPTASEAPPPAASEAPPPAMEAPPGVEAPPPAVESLPGLPAHVSPAAPAAALTTRPTSGSEASPPTTPRTAPAAPRPAARRGGTLARAVAPAAPAGASPAPARRDGPASQVSPPQGGTAPAPAGTASASPSPGRSDAPRPGAPPATSPPTGASDAPRPGAPPEAPSPTGVSATPPPVDAPMPGRAFAWSLAPGEPERAPLIPSAAAPPTRVDPDKTPIPVRRPPRMDIPASPDRPLSRVARAKRAEATPIPTPPPVAPAPTPPPADRGPIRRAVAALLRRSRQTPPPEAPSAAGPPRVGAEPAAMAKGAQPPSGRPNLQLGSPLTASAVPEAAAAASPRASLFPDGPSPARPAAGIPGPGAPQPGRPPTVRPTVGLVTRKPAVTRPLADRPQSQTLSVPKTPSGPAIPQPMALARTARGPLAHPAGRADATTTSQPPVTVHQPGSVQSRLARAPAAPSVQPPAAAQMAGFGGSPAAHNAAAGHSGGTGHGGDADAIYDEVLRRVRQEQEQLGQLITHPF